MRQDLQPNKAEQVVQLLQDDAPIHVIARKFGVFPSVSRAWEMGFCFWTQEDNNLAAGPVAGRA